MHHLALLALALTSTAQASLLQKRQSSTSSLDDDEDASFSYLQQVCLPVLSNSTPDFSAPCNVVGAIELQCIYGPSIDPNSLNNLRYEIDNDDMEEQDIVAQRDCVCQSQFYDQVSGCMACYNAHGGREILGAEISDAALASMSSSYCAVSSTPTAGLAEVLLYLNTSAGASATSSALSTSAFSDLASNFTAVSLYFTPAVTGSAAYVVAQPTAAGNASAVSFTSLNTVSGLIAPTTSAAQGAESASASGSATSEAGAAETAALKLGGAGMLGLAAVVAML